MAITYGIKTLVRKEKVRRSGVVCPPEVDSQKLVAKVNASGFVRLARTNRDLYVLARTSQKE